MTKYSTPSPTIPPFLFKRVANKFVAELIRWARNEYMNTVTELYLTKQGNKAKYLERNCSYLDFLARSGGFRMVVSQMSDEVWKSLDRKTRDILIQANDKIGVG
jgi:hypothetical protein